MFYLSEKERKKERGRLRKSGEETEKITTKGARLNVGGRRGRERVRERDSFSLILLHRALLNPGQASQKVAEQRPVS